MAAENYVPVCDLEELETEGRRVVSEDGRAIALFFHEGEVHAVDNPIASTSRARSSARPASSSSTSSPRRPRGPQARPRAWTAPRGRGLPHPPGRLGVVPAVRRPRRRGGAPARARRRCPLPRRSHPTRRENGQTFSIATRRHRGERLHEAE